MSEPEGVDALRSTAEAADPALAGRSIVAVGWATVDLERSMAMAHAKDGSQWETAGRDGLLGARTARAVQSRPGSFGGVEVVLLEPDTEGLLAATLARFGEGLAVAWFAPDPAGTRSRGRRSEIAATPFGPGRLVLGGPRWGPHAIVLEPAEP